MEHKSKININTDDNTPQKNFGLLQSKLRGPKGSVLLLTWVMNLINAWLLLFGHTIST